jgi:hypothetical protein
MYLPLGRPLRHRLLRGDDASVRRGDGAIEILQDQAVDVICLRNRVIELLESR